MGSVRNGAARQASGFSGFVFFVFFRLGEEVVTGDGRPVSRFCWWVGDVYFL